MSQSQNRQYATFFLEDRMYGIDVMQVQEVTRALPLSPIRLAPAFVKGLINLRGQIATAIGLRELFGLRLDGTVESMTVVCRTEGNLLSFQVDRIGDVIEVLESDFEETPDTIDDSMKKFMNGVYKSQEFLLSVIGIDKISQELNKRTGSG